jgi:endogenous inhibitor of DNA gyrase (YacG/DUF329 family)
MIFEKRTNKFSTQCPDCGARVVVLRTVGGAGFVVGNHTEPQCPHCHAGVVGMRFEFGPELTESVDMGDAPFRVGDEVYLSRTGEKCTVAKVWAEQPLVEDKPKWMAKMTSGKWSFASSFATEPPARLPEQPKPRCPICGGVMTKSNSFIDAGGFRRHEGC